MDLCDCNFFCLQTHRRNHRDHPTEFIFFSANHHNHHRLSSMAPFITSQSLATLVCLTNCTSFEATNFFSDGLQQLKIKITHSPLTIFLGFPHGNCPSHFASYLVYCLYSSSNLTCPIYQIPFIHICIPLKPPAVRPLSSQNYLTLNQHRQHTKPIP